MGELLCSTIKYDLEERKDMYKRYGVKEYWIVDPATRSVQGFCLNEEGQYEEPEKSNGQLRSRLLDTRFYFD